MKRVLADAVSFGYGPGAKLLAIAKALRSHQAPVAFLARGTTQELAEAAGFDVIICDTEDSMSLAAHRTEFMAADLFMSVMNPTALQFAQTLGVRTAYIDSLFWMWDEVPAAFRNVDVACIQNFIGVPERMRQTAFRGDAVCVGPIVDRAFVGDTRGDGLLVNLGGVESQFVSANRSAYVDGVVRQVLDALPRDHFGYVTVCGGRNAIDHLRAQGRSDQVTFATYSHDEFLQELARSAVLLTSPGLTTTYEAFVYGTPTYFLPPQNFSQAIILERLRANGLAPLSLDWTELYPEMQVAVGLKEDVAVARVIAALERFTRDANAQRVLRGRIGELAVQATPRGLAQAQAAFISRMGGDGAAQAAASVAGALGAGRSRVF